MGIIYAENRKPIEINLVHHVCKWEPIKAFYNRYKRTGFMRHNRVYLSVYTALLAKE